MFFVGDVLCDRYKLNELINRGGMGEVWIAEDKALERNVAIKTINPNFLKSNPGAISIFKDEAIIGASLLGQPNVVAILDYGKQKVELDNEEYFIVMEYIDGIDVSKFINEIKPKLSEETYYYISLFIAWEMCRAIEYAHKQGILHRDIKPQNAFISKYGITKVGDFGLSRFVDEITRTHTVSNFNSPPYCAPEQWRGGKITRETDIYQLGCTLYQLFTGNFIYNKSRVAQMLAHLEDIPVPPKNYSTNMSEELSDGILKMVAKNEEDRGSLWELNDIIAKELHKTFSLTISVDKNNKNEIKKVCELTDFSDENFLEKGESSYDFPDFNEILSEGIQLILQDITTFEIKAMEKSENLITTS